MPHYVFFSLALLDPYIHFNMSGCRPACLDFIHCLSGVLCRLLCHLRQIFVSHRVLSQLSSGSEAALLLGPHDCRRIALRPHNCWRLQPAQTTAQTCALAGCGQTAQNDPELHLDVAFADAKRARKPPFGRWLSESRSLSRNGRQLKKGPQKQKLTAEVHLLVVSGCTKLTRDTFFLGQVALLNLNISSTIEDKGAFET